MKNQNEIRCMKMALQLDILSSGFVQEMMKTTANLYRLGWDERNGGNISYLLKEEEVAPYLDLNAVIRTIPVKFDASALAGKYFIVTGSGKYFKNVIDAPAVNLGVIRVAQDGKNVELLWGLEGGGVPTSELPAHFMTHIARLAVDPEQRIVIHTHATHLLAMTFTHPLDEKAFTRTLWQMCTECLVVFPEGVGIIPWIVPGTNEIGEATAAKMHDCRLVIWPHHGIYGAGRDMDETFGLIETAEKAAQVYTYVQAQGGVKQTITDRQLKDLADAFGVAPRAGFLEV
ncbi:rhamnulose-1-phosphate aldolase [Weizmannia acidilactici]|uniref:Rhamnulose-1-phosphate aldolase n=2 Tax=Weizmannia acidilactici TaxID=2607726 RepID=A0A5J4JQ31_9BACI|nr:rhamnulose-1-phosphate aldolase [Weizmannia acidilactici]